MRTINGLTDEQYNLLVSCFKCDIPLQTISRLVRIPFGLVCHEKERWKQCCAIHNLQVPPRKPKWNEIHLSNSSKVFSY